jgi:uncharacterized protein (DUF608 family)
MNRRKFVLSSVASFLGLRGSVHGWLHSLFGGARLRAAAGFQLPWTGPYPELHERRLFPANLSDSDWVQFPAQGFSQPACGVIHTRAHPAVNGMPLGGPGTGYLDLETNGTFGYCTLFNSGVPLHPIRRPFLALRLPGGGKTWVLTTERLLGLRNAQDILYWGHYPVADLEYITDAPVSVGMRAWSPFVPGDVRSSNTPGAVFEVHLRNVSDAAQQGSLIFNFPGPTQAEAQIAPGSLREMQTLGWYKVRVPVAKGLIPARRKDISGEITGVVVTADTGTGYVLGTVGEEKVRYGRAIGQVEGYPEETPGEWAASVEGPARPRFFLPPVQETDFSTSLAVEFDLKPEEEKVVRIVLAWYSPVWRGEGENTYTRMYATRYSDALAVARMLAREHEPLLKRVLAWQEAIYTEGTLPVWLRESLVNVLYLMTKCSYWAAAKPPIGDWCRAEDGLFGMTESPRECPQIECIPNSFYGNIPLVYFFPELALSTLRGYKAYMFPSGTVPWIFGGITGGAAVGYKETDGADMATPSPGYQITSNGICYVDMVDRYWLHTGDDKIIREFYPSIKKNTIFTMNLRPAPEGVISMPAGNVNPFSVGHLGQGSGLEWFEGVNALGMAIHVAGIHLAQIRLAQRMAEKLADTEFVRQCETWLEQGSKLMEEKLWAGNSYLTFYDPESGRKSDLVFSAQLDGEWIVRFHGLPGVFPPARIKTALETIVRLNVPPTPYGVVNLVHPDGTLDPKVGYGPYGMFVPEVYMFAMTLMYAGERELGRELARRCVHNQVLQHRYTWTGPNVIRGDTGERTYGSDYYQNMMLWAVPAALAQTDLQGVCRPGGLIDRVLQAGKEPSEQPAT